MTDPPNKLPQCLIHPTLMCHGCVPTTHGHDNPFVKSKWRHDGRELYVVWVYSCLKKGVRCVNFAPDRPFCAIGQDRLNAQKWVVVRHHVLATEQRRELVRQFDGQVYKVKWEPTEVSEPNPCPGDVRMVDYKPELLESEVGGAH